MVGGPRSIAEESWGLKGFLVDLRAAAKIIFFWRRFVACCASGWVLIGAAQNRQRTAKPGGPA